MTENTKDPDGPIAWWRARASLMGGHWTDAADGFGGLDVAEAVGDPQAIGTELTRFLNSLEWANVEALRLGTGHFAVRLEVEPHDGPVPLTSPPQDDPAEDPVSLWEASAAVGNAQGVFDAAYGYGNSKGDEGHLLGTAHEVGVELARVLKDLTRKDVEIMKYGTHRFILELLIRLPEKK